MLQDVHGQKHYFFNVFIDLGKNTTIPASCASTQNTAHLKTVVKPRNILENQTTIV